MRILCTLILLLLGYFCNGQNPVKIKANTEISFKEILEEVKWFIAKSKKESIQNGKYDVYLVKLLIEGENQYCATMGLISDSLLIAETTRFNYLIRLNKELVLLDYSDEFKNKFILDDKTIEPLINRKVIADKIYPGVAFLGFTPGYVCCYYGRDIVKKYFWNSDEIPYDKKIFKSIPSGKPIKLDSNMTKQMFIKKKKK